MRSKFGLSVADMNAAGFCNASQRQFHKVFPELETKERVVFNKRNWNRAMQGFIEHGDENINYYINPVEVLNRLDEAYPALSWDFMEYEERSAVLLYDASGESRLDREARRGRRELSNEVYKLVAKNFQEIARRNLKPAHGSW